MVRVIANSGGGGTISNCRLLTHQGKTQSVSQWAKELNIFSSTITTRLRRGLGVQDALSTSYLPRKTRTTKVKCVETGVIYESLTKAANETCVNFANISNACRGRRKTAGGYHWEYVEAERG